MARFICKECGYGFENSEIIKRCPYCSKDRVEEEQNAEEIIREIEEILE